MRLDREFVVGLVAACAAAVAAPASATTIDWPQIVGLYHQQHEALASQTPVPGAGSVVSASCGDYYPALSHFDWLASAYLITRNEKYRGDLERQLAYAHSRQNVDRLLVPWRPNIESSGASGDGQCDESVVLTRDSQARQVYEFYFAYRLLGETMYLKWADELAQQVLTNFQRAPYATPLGAVQGFRGVPYTGGRSFFSLYGKPSGVWSPYIATGATAYAKTSTDDITVVDPNQNAEWGLALYLLQNDPVSSHYGQADLSQIVSDEFAAATALQVLNTSTPYLSNVAVNCSPTLAAVNACAPPRLGAISDVSGMEWAWDELYGSYVLWSLTAARALVPSHANDSAPLRWQSAIQLGRTWFQPVSNNPTSPAPISQTRFYDGHWTYLARDDVNSNGQGYADSQSLWMYRFPVLFYGGDPNVAPAARCSADALVGGFLSQLLSNANTSASGDVYNQGGAAYHAYFSLLGIPPACYLPHVALVKPAVGANSVFVTRGSGRIVRLSTITGADIDGTAPRGHSQWLGEQSFDFPVSATATTSDSVYVALNTGGHGRVIRYHMTGTGQSSFNVFGDGVTQIPGVSAQLIGYQDFDGVVDALSSDGKSVFVAARTSAGSRLSRYAMTGGGASMFNVAGNGVTQIAGVSVQYRGHQDFASHLQATSADAAQLYLGFESVSAHRLQRVDVGGLGTGASMLYVLPDGVTPLAGMANASASLRPGYQDFMEPVTALQSTGRGVLYVALATARPSGPQASGRIIRYQHPEAPTGASLFYADATGVTALPAWQLQFNAMNVDSQDFANPVYALSQLDDSLFVNAEGDEIPLHTDVGLQYPSSGSYFRSYLIKYHEHDSPRTSGVGMWRVASDGVTPKFGAPSVNYELSPTYANSIIEYTQYESLAHPSR